MRRLLLTLSAAFLTLLAFSQNSKVVNFTFGPVLNINSINTSQLDTFAISWNDYYKVDMQKGYSNFSKSFISKGFEMGFESYGLANLSFHWKGSMGMNWGSQENTSLLWNNYEHSIKLKYSDVPIFGGAGIAVKGIFFLDASLGANFRNAVLLSTVKYPDGSRSMGYEMDILGYYESSIPKYFYGLDASLRLSRIMLTARASFPMKNKLVADNVMVDYDVNRYRQSEFPIDFRTFVYEVSAVNEANMLRATNLHSSIISLSAKILIGKIN